MTKKSIEDPNAEREQANYDSPIASRELLLDLLANQWGPNTYEQLVARLHYDEEQSIALSRRLNAMERAGQLVRNRAGFYGPVTKMNLLAGRVIGHRDGYGFFKPIAGGDDLMLNHRQMRRVFDGDEVLVRAGRRARNGKREAIVVEVVKRKTDEFVGRIINERGVIYLQPENNRIGQDILIDPSAVKGAEQGQMAVIKVVQWPTDRNMAMGEVIEVLGEHLAPGMEIDVALRNHGVPHHWPLEVTEQASQLPVEVSADEIKGRRDLRKVPLITIDGEDARDFDDAVYAEPKKGGGWRLIVAIADVSHYVAPRSALDTEAINRGNSTYFPDFVVPMLPEALSNGLCSLNPDVDRLCMVCEMTISAAGKISSYKFYEAVMHSHARMTYTQVGQMIGERVSGGEARDAQPTVAKQVDVLHDLYQVFQAQRAKRGAIAFETVETRILFDAQRKIEKIVPVVRNDAHKLIEECMLAANQCAAKLLTKANLSGLYRVHQGPKDEKLANLRKYLGGLGLNLGGGEKPSPGDYQVLMEQIEGRTDQPVIQTMMLRSMQQAVYTPDNEGHFGLAFVEYTHFTSPIRRYPDLMVHRAIRYLIRNHSETVKQVVREEGADELPQSKIYPYDMPALLQCGDQCSLTERRSDDAARDVVSWLKCEYLSAHIGDEFNGRVTAAATFGVFVELDDIFVEGLIHVANLGNDYFNFDEVRQMLIGERTGLRMGLGDRLRVRVARVDLDERKIDFELVEHLSRAPRKSSTSDKSVKSSKKKSDRSGGKRRDSFDPFEPPKSKSKEKTKGAKASVKKAKGKKKTLPKHKKRAAAKAGAKKR